ncbi:MAG: hypothetical protein WBV66_01705, partial [Pseudolabrys sp.]
VMASGGLAFPCQAAALLDAVRLDNQASKSGYFTEASQTAGPFVHKTSCRCPKVGKRFAAMT